MILAELVYITEMSAGIIGREIVHLKGSLNELPQGSSRVFSAFLGVTPVEHALKALDNPSLLAGRLEPVATAQRAIASLDWGLPIFHLRSLPNDAHFV